MSITPVILLLAGLFTGAHADSLGSSRKIAITLSRSGNAVSSVRVKPATPSPYPDNRYGWFHLERSVNGKSWSVIDYNYGTWSDFELIDNNPPLNVSLYRVVFFQDI